MTLYEDLGVEKNATSDDIKNAFRYKVKDAHPDTGGNSEEFITLVRAYDILLCEEKRKRYDDGENVESINRINSHEHDVLNMLFNLFNAIIEQQTDVIHQNIFEIMRQSIRNQNNIVRQEKNKQQNNVKRFEEILGRIHKKEESEKFIKFLDNKIKDTNRIILNFDNTIKVGSDALKLIEDCEYDVEPIDYKPSLFRIYNNTSTTGTGTGNW